MNGGAHRTGTLVLSLVMIVIGVALFIEAASSHGGLFTPRGLLALLFVAAGVLRIRMMRRRDGEHGA